jgi:hypothetical protein
MSRTLIQEGLIALSEIAQRGISDDQTSYGIPKFKSITMSRGLTANFDPDNQPSWLSKSFGRSVSDKEYRDILRKNDGSWNRYHRDGNYVEWNPYSYGKTDDGELVISSDTPAGDRARRHGQDIIGSGGIKTPQGSVLYQDPYQQQQSLNKLQNTLTRQRRAK